MEIDSDTNIDQLYDSHLFETNLNFRKQNLENKTWFQIRIEIYI